MVGDTHWLAYFIHSHLIFSKLAFAFGHHKETPTFLVFPLEPAAWPVLWSWQPDIFTAEPCDKS